MQSATQEKRVCTEQETSHYIGMSRSFLRQSRMEGLRNNHTQAPPFIKIIPTYPIAPKIINRTVYKLRRKGLIKYQKVYTQLMGGVFCKRKEEAFQPHYEVSFDSDTGVVKTSQYCESELVRALKGVAIAGKAIITRLHEWRIAFQVPCVP